MQLVTNCADFHYYYYLKNNKNPKNLNCLRTQKTAFFSNLNLTTKYYPTNWFPSIFSDDILKWLVKSNIFKCKPLKG